MSGLYVLLAETHVAPVFHDKLEYGTGYELCLISILIDYILISVSVMSVCRVLVTSNRARIYRNRYICTGFFFFTLHELLSEVLIFLIQNSILFFNVKLNRICKHQRK